MVTDDRVRQLIAQADALRAAAVARRQRLNDARRHGLAALHHLKLARLDVRNPMPPTDPGPPDAA